ncbi:MAG: UvrD-helicase domain-containing protein [Patescibacteria group bacterium]
MHDNLNPQQKAAVLHKDGALLILAGAGAGKTRVVTHRIAELIKSGVAPEKILAVTFTNKAAAEMRERITHLMKESLALSPYDTPHTTPFMSTFHGLGLHILKTFNEVAGLPKRFTIFDRADSTRAAKKAIEQAGFDPKELEPRRVLSIMGRAKGDALNAEGFLSERASSYIDEAVAEVWTHYDAILKQEKALDFDDILLKSYELLLKNEVPRHFFQDAWSHIHVDEYQDTNRVQYELVRMLAAGHGNLCAVGDADQNIYSWRGASISHILDFENDFPGSQTLLLTQNYRSTKNILQVANDAIAKNIRRKEKELFTDNPEGELISVSGHVDEIAEAQFVTGAARHLIQNGSSPNDIAVLYRANFQSRVLEEAFLGSGIPYQVLGTRFFERKEIKDVLSYVRLAENGESATDLSRVMNVPARGIGKVTLAKVVNGERGDLSSAQQKKVADFFTLIERIAQQFQFKKVSEAVAYTIKESGMWALYEAGKGEDEERLENLKELVSVATKYDTLPTEEGVQKLLEEAALQSDQDELMHEKREKKLGVKLMTVHASKGLEYETVFVTGLEEGLFPHERDGVDADDSEEERRLFYVALTRAQKKVFLTYAQTRRIFGTRSLNTPSTFISELDPALTLVTLPTYREFDRHPREYLDDDDVIQ